MTEIMLVIIFLLGVVLVLAGLFLLIFKRGAGGGGGGLTIQIGEWISLSTPRASLAIVVLGSILIYTGLAGALRINRDEEKLESQETMLEARKNKLKLSTPILAAITKIPFGSFFENTRSKSTQWPERRYEALQEDALDSLSALAEEEDLALAILEGLSENTFGLAKIPSENASRFSRLLSDVTRRFPNNAALQIQAADVYRSLYETTKDSHYRDAWGRIVHEGSYGTDLGKEEVFLLHTLRALHLLSNTRYEEALEQLKKAESAVPPHERFKLEFNYCNVYYSMKKHEEARRHCELSERQALDQGLPYWPPVFILSLIEQHQAEYKMAASLFGRCYEIAQSKQETELLEYYLSSQGNFLELCKIEEFSKKFTRFCDEP